MSGRPSLDDIITAACKVTGVTRAAFLGHDRPAQHVYARQLAAHIAQAHGYPYPQIGRAFDRKHTTVLRGARKIEQRLQAGDVGIVATLEQARELASSYASQRVAA